MDKTKKMLNDMRLIGKEIGLWKHGYGYRYFFSSIVRDINLNGKNALEIGCSDGRHCVTASIYGANHVIGLEPIADGSGPSKKAFTIFRKLVTPLNINNVELLPLKIQDYEHKHDYFDVVFSLASINHWEEDACIHLQEKEDARELYSLIFKKIHKMMKDRGKLIIMECSNRNLFGDLGVKNPFHPRMHWNKHQSPEVWARLLSSCGFSNPKITWLLDYRLRYLERLLGNKLTSYCLGSAFRLEMTCNK